MTLSKTIKRFIVNFCLKHVHNQCGKALCALDSLMSSMCQITIPFEWSWVLYICIVLHDQIDFLLISPSVSCSLVLVIKLSHSFVTKTTSSGMIKISDPKWNYLTNLRQCERNFYRMRLVLLVIALIDDLPNTIEEVPSGCCADYYSAS